VDPCDVAVILQNPLPKITTALINNEISNNYKKKKKTQKKKLHEADVKPHYIKYDFHTSNGNRTE
jgi:hypothetical protein